MPSAGNGTLGVVWVIGRFWLARASFDLMLRLPQERFQRVRLGGFGRSM